MKHSEENIETTLRSAAPAARRDPPPGLRARVMGALEPRVPASDVTVRMPMARRSWRERTREIAVAAAVVAALGAWIAAFVLDSPTTVGVGNRSPFAGVLGTGPGVDTLRIPSAPSPVSALAQATPNALHDALDGRLTSELDGIARDAAGALTFLAGRLPAPLVLRASDGSTR
jgi:hypothetical protein